ncbi:hypothetical protein DJ71_24550, partial [Halorubrum sp. E3]
RPDRPRRRGVLTVGGGAVDAAGVDPVEVDSVETGSVGVEALGTLPKREQKAASLLRTQSLSSDAAAPPIAPKTAG